MKCDSECEKVWCDGCIEAVVRKFTCDSCRKPLSRGSKPNVTECQCQGPENPEPQGLENPEPQGLWVTGPALIQRVGTQNFRVGGEELWVIQRDVMDWEHKR
jgi:hypothetical protein